MSDSYLDIVDDNGSIINRALRSEIHKNGWLHQIIRIWFITPEKDVIFQKRSLSKDVHPGLLTVSVGGHVESGDTVINTALKEAFEETGQVLRSEDLHFLTVRKKDEIDSVSKSHDHELQNVFGYIYMGKIEDLKIEPSDSDGYIVIPFDELESFSGFEPSMKSEFALIRDKLEKLVA